MDVQQWLADVPAISVYVLVGVVVGVESLGIPLPGEIVLVAAALLSSQQGTVNPFVVGACASAGAVIGDSIGYAIGRKGGRPLLAWLGRTFPKHFSSGHVAAAERSFEKWGMWAVFFGRFVALLRIFAGPLSGVLRMPYWKFLTANLLGGVVWAGGTTAVIYYVGVVAESWLKRFSWLGLLVAVLIGLVSLLVVRRKAKHSEQSGRPEEQSGRPEQAGHSEEAGHSQGAGRSDTPASDTPASDAVAEEADRAPEAVPAPGQGGTE